MKYEDIKDFRQRCDTHPDHQNGVISHAMVLLRLQEEVAELRHFIERADAENERDTDLLRQTLTALEYAADHTEPSGPNCQCPICLGIAAVRERLGEMKYEANNV